MLASSRVAAKPAVARSASRKAVTVRAQAQTQKANVATAVAAVFTAAVVLAAPAFAKDDVTEKVRNAVCAANPTAKMCLRDSFSRSQEAQQ